MADARHPPLDGARLKDHAPRRLAALFVILLSATLPAARQTQAVALGSAERIAEGVLFYRLDDPALLDPPGHVSVQALQLDPGTVRLATGVAQAAPVARETVLSIAQRQRALAAINAGFFSLADGKPQSLLKSAGALLGSAGRARGAVALTDRRGRPHLLFDRVRNEPQAGTGTGYRTRFGTRPEDWAGARDAVSGAGLLLVDGRELNEWSEEQISVGFDTARHPRTMIGVDAAGAIWLVTIDGRQPALSLGMNFAELQRLARRLGLRSALNLDGGGSTTMVVKGFVVNHPSDDTGPRHVSDAILVFPKEPIR